MAEKGYRLHNKTTGETRTVVSERAAVAEAQRFTKLGHKVTLSEWRTGRVIWTEKSAPNSLDKRIDGHKRRS